MPAPLTLTVNGESRRTTAATVADLVRELGLDPAKVAVERNGAIAPRSTLEGVALGDGDQLEIVHFVGGGDQSQLAGPTIAGRSRATASPRG